MRYNILNKTFIIYILTAFTLVSCDSNGVLKKSNSKTSVQQDGTQSDDSTKLDNKESEITIYSNNDNPNEKDTESLKLKETGEKNLASEEKLEKDEENLGLKEQDKQSLASDENQEKAKLIAEITKKTKDSEERITEYNKKTENDDQYGMKMHVFKLLIISSNQKPINYIANKGVRQTLYSSLDWNEDTIKKFGQILNAIVVNDTQKLAKSILISGITYTQSYFEKTVKEINKKKDNLNKLEIAQLKDIKNNLLKVEALRNKWQDTVNQIINDYEANTSDIKDNSKKLKQYVISKYNTIFKTELPQIEKLHQNITNVVSLKK